MAEIEKLRKAREMMSRHFPLTPGKYLIIFILLCVTLNKAPQKIFL
jgi:hypothetical protein